MKIFMDFVKSDAQKRKVKVHLDGDHEIAETLHADIKTRMAHLGWEQNTV